MILNNILHKIRSLRYYVMADPADNSITLSRHLFRHMKAHAGKSGEASVFMFRITEDGAFGFMAGHGITQPTQLCQVQYNEKYKCVGFETLCPSVGRIFFDYGLPALHPVKLSVSVRRTPRGAVYYQLDIPTSKQLHLCKVFSETHAKRT